MSEENGLKEINYIPVNLRGQYLPNLLTKLGEFSDNTECRKFIREKGVLIDGNLVMIPSISFPSFKIETVANSNGSFVSASITIPVMRFSAPSLLLKPKKEIRHSIIVIVIRVINCDFD